MGGRCVEKLPHQTDKCNSKKGLQVFEENGKYSGFCFACGTHVPNPYQDKPEGYKPAVAFKSPEEIENEIAEIRDEFWYHDLPDRKLKKEYLEYFGVKVGVSEVDGSTPVSHYYPYTTEGVLKGYKVRIIEGKIMYSIGKLKDTDPFGWDKAVLTGAKRVYITEGELDAVALFQIFKDQAKGSQYEAYNPAVISLSNGAGGALKNMTQWMPTLRKHFKEIVLVFDNDKPGKDAAQAVVKAFPGVMTVELPEKDANECLIKGRSKAAQLACTFKAEVPKNTRLVNVSDVKEDARTQTPWGFSYPFKELTEITRGQRLGETVYWGSGVKMGKSELLNALVAHNIIEHGWKVFVVKPEESNKRTLQGVVGKVVNRIFHDPKIEFDYEAFDKGVEIIGDKLVMLNLYQELSWDSLEVDIRTAAGDGCKAVFIDPITVLTNGVNPADANTLLQKFSQGLAQLAMDLNIIVHIFCHLKAPDNGPAHERGGSVQSHQFAGSRAMMRACHSMIGLEGNKDPALSPEERNMRELVVLEDRATGSTGKVKMYWNSATGAFTEIKST